jgi:RND family efflux transporter MFP subunit
MKKLLALGIVILILGSILMILIWNKTKMEAKADALKLAAIPVSVRAVTMENVNLTMEHVGVIKAYQDVVVVSETQGRVVAVKIKNGSRVAMGAPLVYVDSALQRSRYLASQINYEKAKKDLERYESLYQQEIISLSQVESLRLAFKAAEAEYLSAQKYYKDTYVTAPISGVVTKRLVEQGEVINPGTPIANIVDLSRLKVTLNLPEEDAFRIKAGDPVKITSEIYRGVQFDGIIDNISDKGDEAHTFPVEITFHNNKETPLKAGMFGKVTFMSQVTEPALLLPRNALVGSIKDPQVFVVKNKVAELRNIVLGGEVNDDLIVLKGLNPGEIIVISGQENLVNNAEVSIVK